MRVTLLSLMNKKGLGSSPLSRPDTLGWRESDPFFSTGGAEHFDALRIPWVIPLSTVLLF